MKNTDQDLAGNRKDVNSSDANHSFLFQEGKDSIPKAGCKALGNLCLFPSSAMRFYVPLSQSLVPTFSNAVVLTGPWLLDGLLSIHGIYSERETLVGRKRALIKPRQTLTKSTFLSNLLIKRISCRAVNKQTAFFWFRIVLVCVDVKPLKFPQTYACESDARTSKEVQIGLPRLNLML